MNHRAVIKVKDIHVICYAICIFLFALGHTKVQNISPITGIMVTYGKFVPLFVSVIILISGMKTIYRRIGFFAIFLLLIGFCYICHDMSYVMVFLVYFMFACSNSEDVLIYKAYSYAVFIVIILTIVAALTGIVVNDNETAGRYDLGFTY